LAILRDNFNMIQDGGWWRIENSGTVLHTNEALLIFKSSHLAFLKHE
jgi:hypothetical protein